MYIRGAQMPALHVHKVCRPFFRQARFSGASSQTFDLWDNFKHGKATEGKYEWVLFVQIPENSYMNQSSAANF